MPTTEATLWEKNDVSSIATPRIKYTVDYSFNYEKHNALAETCSKEVIQLATPIMQDLPNEGQEVNIAEIHEFPGIDELYGLQSSKSGRKLLAEDQINRIRGSIEAEMKILAQKNGLVCNTSADIPGTSLVLQISLERDLGSIWIDSNIPGISTCYKKSFLKVSLQKIPSDNIIPIPSQSLAERILARVKWLF